MKLSKSQTERLADFFNDVAKGLFLGVAVNQAVPTTGQLSVRLLISLAGITVTAFFLYAAVSLSKDQQEIW